MRFIIMALALMAMFSTASAECQDVEHDKIDNAGDGCAFYVGNEWACGFYDDYDFYAQVWCCACGGGVDPDKIEPGKPMFNTEGKDQGGKHGKDGHKTTKIRQDVMDKNARGHHHKNKGTPEFHVKVAQRVLNLYFQASVEAGHEGEVLLQVTHEHTLEHLHRVTGDNNDKRRKLWDGCMDLDYDGEEDIVGDKCDSYYGNEWACGLFDDDDFKADWWCCACGGGW